MPSDNTNAPKPATKKRFFRYFQILLIFIVFCVPLLSLKKYSEILLATPPALTESQADCAVVLTGAAGRIREGITLLSHRQVQKLIISGVHQHSTLADMYPEILFYPEIRLENVILERRSSSTAGNAQASLPIVEALNCQTILLVTSDYHMHRAMKTFAQMFPGAIRITPYPISSDRLHPRHTHILDTRFWGTVFEEWCKYLFYEVFVF